MPCLGAVRWDAEGAGQRSGLRTCGQGGCREGKNSQWTVLTIRLRRLALSQNQAPVEVWSPGTKRVETCFGSAESREDGQPPPPAQSAVGTSPTEFKLPGSPHLGRATPSNTLGFLGLMSVQSECPKILKRSDYSFPQGTVALIKGWRTLRGRLGERLTIYILVVEWGT